MVMMLLGIAAAMAVPSLRGFSQGRLVGSCAAQVVSLGQWARTQAVTRGEAYRLNVDPATGTYWLTVDRRGAFEHLGEEFGRVFAAPEGVTLTWHGPAAAGVAHPYVEFLPTGRTTAAAAVRIADARGGVAEVACRSPGEAFRVMADWERTTR